MIEKISLEASNKITNMSFLCAVLVLMIHMERTAECYTVNLLNGSISQIAVPFFFAVSGFLLLNRFGEKGWYKEALTKRFYSLFIPFVCLNICWFPFKYAIHYIGYIYFGADHSNYTMVFSFSNFLRAFSPIAIYGSPCVGPLWYVRALMWLVVFSPIVAYFVCGTKKLCSVFMIAVTILWGLEISKIVNVQEILSMRMDNAQVGLDYSFRCLFYFSFGMMVRRWDLWNVRKGIGLSALIIGVSTLIACFFLENEVRIYIHTIAVLFTIIGFWWAVPANIWPPYLTKNSYVIFALHTILIYLGHTSLKAIKAISYFDHGIGVWVLSFVYLIICCYIGCIVRRRAPKISFIFFGGR